MTPSTPRPLTRRATLALTLTLAAACTLDLPEPEPQRPISLCQTSDACPDPLRCEAGFCVVDTDIQEIVGVEVTPLEADGLGPEHFPAVTLRAGSPLPDLRLASPQQLQGSVRLDGTPPRNLAARLILTRRQPALPDRALRFDALATPSGGWFVRVPPGWYDINALPTDTSLPPQTVLGLPVQSDTLHNVIIPPLTEAITVRGQIIYLDQSFNRDAPVPGARVEAVGPDQRVVSTTTTTADDGTFTLLLRPDVGAYALAVSPDPAITPALPRILVNDLQVLGASVELGTLSLGPTLPSGRRVEGRTLDINGDPVPGVRVLAQSDLSNPSTPNITTRFSADAVSDDQGRFAFALQPGTYTVQAIPPIDSGSALTAAPEREVTPPGTLFDLDAWNLRLRPKTRVRGQIRTADAAAPLPGRTRITLQNISLFGLNDGAPSTGQRNTTAISDPSGAFEALVDPGEYILQATPPVESGWASSPPVRVQIRATVTQEVNLCALHPSVAYGTLLDPDQRPLANAKIELFRLDSPRGPWSLGSTRTTEDGTYRLLIPRLCDGDPACEAECPAP